MRGRVIARDGGAVIVRGERADVRVEPAPAAWQIGHVVDGDAIVGGAAAFPGAASEVTRLSRTRMTRLHDRARVAAAVRRFFAERDFVEVETPLLVPSPGLELHLDAVPAGGGFLITSPEYAMKRLLAAGFERIVQLCKCFRAGEHGPHHASEFTMIEWYRAFAALDAIAADTEQLVHAVCGDTVRIGAASSSAASSGAASSGASSTDASSSVLSSSSVLLSSSSGASSSGGSSTDASSSVLSSSSVLLSSSSGASSSGSSSGAGGGRSISVTPPWRRMTVRDAMATWAGVIVRGDESAAELVAAVRAAGIDIATDLAWDDAFFTAFLARVEPRLASLDHALLLEDWPAPLAALARRHPDDPRIALRFEAYVGGIELANAFDELVDPAEQRTRFEAEQRERAARGRPVYPIDERLIAALVEGLPPSAGIALGFDRLVMLATGAGTIDEVLAFGTGEI